ncbi:MAG: AAA family ATPase, partial [Ktedonobacteraceae bacterium]
MQQQKAAGPVQPPNNGVQRRPFPWVRTIVAFLIVLVLSILTVLGLLATGHVINYVWFFIAPALFALIVAIVPILISLFTFDPVVQPQQPTTALPSSQAHIATAPVVLTQTSTILTQQAPAGSISPVAQIFHFAQSLPSHDEFYGRAYERATLINRTSQRSSTALVGEYRIGKSWLMQYLQQSAPTHAQLGPQIRIGRLSATHPQCQTLAGFVKKALEALNVSTHRPNPHETPLERLAIEAGELKRQGIIPVLCIDEFAGLIGMLGFGKSFVKGLRAIAENDGLVLITASKDPLHTVIEHIIGGTSPLFNIMLELT